MKDADFDVKLIAWVREQRAKKNRVSRTLIQKQALAFSSDSTFRASNVWLVNLSNHHNLVSRRLTTICQKEPEHYVKKLTNFVVFVERNSRKTNYQYIFASDETAVYLDSSSSLTVDERGTHQVSVKTVGHEKLHVTVTLTARSDGSKCRPFVLLKNKCPTKHIEEIISMLGLHDTNKLKRKKKKDSGGRFDKINSLTIFFLHNWRIECIKLC